MARVAVVSFRLGEVDGVSVEAAKWVAALGRLGHAVRTVAGVGRADVLVAGLDTTPQRPPDRERLAAALADVDVAVVENLCSLPVNPAATDAVAAALRGRPALLHHHDLPWERAAFAAVAGWPPDDPAWRHVTINERSRRELADRGIRATCVYNTVDPAAPVGRRGWTRATLGVPDGARLLLQPTRAIQRKNVPAGLALAAAVDAVYWLTGPAEEGYGPELDRLLAAAATPVRRRLPAGATMADAYAAADAVALPSTWEGFGNALLESAVHRRPLAVADYPVRRELARLGFRWFPVADPGPLAGYLRSPDPALLDHNERLARRHFAPATLDRALGGLLAELGVSPPAPRSGHGRPGTPTPPPSAAGR